MPEESSFTFPALTSWKRRKMLAIAETVLSRHQEMIRPNGKNILHYTLEKKKRHLYLQHYPKGDRMDTMTGAQYFYHCHREDKVRGEHGHFHCFLQNKHIPKRIKPAPLPDWDKHMNNPMTHLVAIAMNRYGQPIRLFTVNRWVTSETWYAAEHISTFLKRFKITANHDPYWTRLDQWVQGMLQLFSPQIVWLHAERDRIIQQHQANHLNENVYNNAKIEELSEIRVDLKSQIEWIMG